MSYSIVAIGTKDEVLAAIDRQCESNTSPEMPVVHDALHAMLASVEGDDKRLDVQCSGSHSSGYVQHNWTIRTASVPALPTD